jgi:hypothetical protein
VETVPNIEEDRPVDIEQTRESIFAGIHRVQGLVGETKRLILNPTAEPPAIAAPAVLAEPATPVDPAEPEIPNPAR